MLTISEIFHSIQGESTYAGAPCVFVRLAGCDLRCSWCDTPYAFVGGSKMAVEDVVSAVAAFRCDLVEVTGGEPLLQEDVYPLMAALVERGATVLLETGGQISVDRVPEGVVKILDVKCPASGASARNHWPNLERLAPHDQVKFVVSDRADYDFAQHVIARHGLESRCAAVLLSPVHGGLAPADLARWILADGLRARLQLQVHKYIWGAHVRGV
jgi:7-carboxy-7-deazaguanine synthase